MLKNIQICISKTSLPQKASKLEKDLGSLYGTFYVQNLQSFLSVQRSKIFFLESLLHFHANAIIPNRQMSLELTKIISLRNLHAWCFCLTFTSINSSHPKQISSGIYQKLVATFTKYVWRENSMTRLCALIDSPTNNCHHLVNLKSTDAMRKTRMCVHKFSLRPVNFLRLFVFITSVKSMKNVRHFFLLLALRR